VHIRAAPRIGTRIYLSRLRLRSFRNGGGYHERRRILWVLERNH